MNTIITTKNTNPHLNLAVEEILFDTFKDDIMLFLWQNAHTVVIGRNQNAYRECRTALLEKEGGTLSRRTTGGGAVYHDLGNLNFTFIAKQSKYSLERQMSVIAAAAESFGIRVKLSGRNDITTESGAKFSGNAFKSNRTTKMQHGTILISTDMNMLSRYISPSPEKLAAKGVSSVTSRVCNLADLNPCITISSMKQALITAFEQEYGKSEIIAAESLELLGLNDAYKRHASSEWCLGGTHPYDVELSTRFEWGEIQIRTLTANGIITNAQIFSDAMDEMFIASLPSLFIGSCFTAVCDKLCVLNDSRADDIAAWLLKTI